MLIVRIIFSNRNSIIVFLPGETEITCNADCWLMESVAAKCGLESTVWVIEHGVSPLSAQQWGESFSYWSVLSYQTQKPLKLGNLGFKQIFDALLPPSVSFYVCVWTESKAYQLLKQSAMQTRQQICEEQDEDSDSLSGKRFALFLPVAQALINTGQKVSHVEVIYWPYLLYVKNMCMAQI